jgi:glycosyltransferase involved in cell wall biosynthesis
MKLSVIIITLNEENNLRRCLESVKWADEIILVDSGSADGTKKIAAEYGAKIFDVEWKGFGPAKEFALAKAKGEWALSIDADEEVSAPLAQEIRRIINDNASYDGFLIPRRTMFLGKWIKHCGWRPDRVLRFFRRKSGKFDSAVVHEAVKINGTVGTLKGELLHYSYPDFDAVLRKYNLYSVLGARKMHEAGKKASLFDLTVKPPAAFVKHYVVKLGFLDGWRGLLISAMTAATVFMKYANLRWLREQRDLGVDTDSK